MASTLLWFTHNLRLHDNEALVLAAQRPRPLICIYCIDSQWFSHNQYGLPSLGDHRWRFLQQSLYDLSQQLRKRGQRLYILRGDPAVALRHVITQYKVEEVIASHCVGVYEKRQWRQLEESCPHTRFHQTHSFTLFTPSQVQDALGLQRQTFPSSFTQFRKRLEPVAPKALEKIPSQLPPMLGLDADGFELQSIKPLDTPEGVEFTGGESQALAHLQNYFSSTAPKRYKQTRNELSGFSNSTKFSCWLANGSLSPRYLLRALQNYEQQQGANESTYWIYFELLWREFFQWYSEYFKHRLFCFSGVHAKRPLTSFYPQRFQQWAKGETPWDIVNACMQELNRTGYLSNRGRQLVASCLVNELALDWRCGAYYFEKQLIDYDMASNWGNWQYIAGVGADPRGGRHFNLEKQAATYDADYSYRKYWLKPDHPSYGDSVDYVDWPVSR